MKQLVKPNLGLSGQIGWCLQYAQRAFNAGWAGPDAWTAWTTMVKFRHLGTPPNNVYVPIWFDGYWQGSRYGHVAIYFNGKVWSSPYKGGQAYAILGSIAETQRIYGMRYVGWSEDIGGLRVVIKQGDTEVKIGSGENWYNRLNKLHMQVRGRPLGRAVFKSFVGVDTLKYIEAVSDDKEADTVQNWQVIGKLAVTDKWQNQIYSLQAQLKDLSTRPTRAELDKMVKEADKLAKSVAEAQVEVERLKKERSEDSVLLDEAGNWLTQLFNRIFKKEK